MVALLLFIGSAVANAALGHYVTEGLKNVDSTLGKLFEDEADVEVIETYVRDNDLEQQVEEFAAETVKSSFVIPDVSEGAPTLFLRAALFGDILKVGFDISNARRFDALLPGSFLGPHAFTLFSRNRHGVPTITAHEAVVNFKKSTLSVDNLLDVFPISETEGQTLWEEYTSALQDFRSTTSGQYFSTQYWEPLRSLTEACGVKRIMAGAIEYDFPVSMSDEQRESLGMPEESSRAPVQQPYEGIHKMLDGMATLLAIDLLDPSEQEAIEGIYDRLRGFGEETN